MFHDGSWFKFQVVIFVPHVNLLFLYNIKCAGTKEEFEVKYDFLVGADGANSAVRSQIFHLEEDNRHSSK
jgi:flavin-dependent dehydrogenase